MSATDRRRILYLLPFAPRLDATHGGGRALAQLLMPMAERHDLALLYLRAPHEPPIDAALAARCQLAEEILRPEVGTGPWARWRRRLRLAAGFARGVPMQVSDWRSAAFAERLGALLRGWRPEIVQFEYHVMAQYAAVCARSDAPRVLTEYEPGAAAADERLIQRPDRTAGLDARAWRRFEARAVRQMQAVVVFTERDRRALAPLCGTIPLVCIPLGTPLPDAPLSPLGATPERVLFVGSFIHAPNLDAAQWLTGAIFPRVLAARPETQLVIVGEQPPATIQGLASVVVAGRVPDVVPFLDAAAVVVAPLRLGGGMRVKVLEALAAGKAVVASPLAIEGLGVRAGEQVLLAESDEAFAAAIVQLLSDPAQRAALAGRARAWACANLSWERPVAAYEALHRRLLSTSTPIGSLHGR